MGRLLIGLINLTASIITILNVYLAIPSVFKNFELSYSTEITERNFALKFGFILFFQFCIGFFHSSILLQLNRLTSIFLRNAYSLFILLLVGWLTIFNVTEILYSNKELISSLQYFGLLFFLIICYLIHSIILLMSQDAVRNSKSTDNWAIFLGILLLVLYMVYWING